MGHFGHTSLKNRVVLSRSHSIVFKASNTLKGRGVLRKVSQICEWSEKKNHAFGANWRDKERHVDIQIKPSKHRRRVLKRGNGIVVVSSDRDRVTGIERPLEVRCGFMDWAFCFSRRKTIPLVAEIFLNSEPSFSSRK